MLKLFNYDAFKIVISPEAFALKPFRMIWNRDRTVDKEKAIQELGYIYFFCDPRSDYQYITDEEERKKSIMEGEGLSNWKPDKVVIEAMEFYKSFKSMAALLLEDTRFAVDKLRTQIRGLDLNEKDNNGKPLYTLNTITSTIKLIPSLARDLSEAEKALNSEVIDITRKRGGEDKTLMEDDINI